MKRCLFVLCFILMVCLVCNTVLASVTAPVGPALGDPNADGAITATDALYVLKTVVGKEDPTEFQKSACDIDCSDEVGAGDALQMLRLVVGKEVQRDCFDDRTFTIGSVYASKYTDQSAYGKAWQQAVDYAHKAYGITLVVEPLDMSQQNNLWFYDMVELPVGTARSFAMDGKLMDLSNVAAFHSSVTQSGSALSCQLGDSLFGVASDAMSANPMGIAMNRDLLETYAPNASAKLQKQFDEKTWNWTAMQQLVDEYRANRSGAVVMASNTNIIGQAIVANAGYEVDFLPDKTGAVSSIATDEGIAALAYVKELHDSGAYEYNADMNEIFGDFKAGKVPMVVYYLNESAAVLEGDFALTAMPFPIGPGQKDYVMCTFNSGVFAVPAYVTTYGNAHAMVLNAMGMADGAIADGWVSMAAGLGYDSLGQSVYRWAAQNTSHDFSTGPFTGAVGGPVDGSVLDRSMNPYVEIPKIKDVIQKEVDDYYGMFYRSK